jgi:hypothetical protein
MAMTPKAVHFQDDTGLLSGEDHTRIMAAAQLVPAGITIWTTSAYPTRDAFISAVQSFELQGRDQVIVSRHLQDMPRDFYEVVIAIDPVHGYTFIHAKPATGFTSDSIGHAMAAANAQFNSGHFGSGLVNAIHILAGGASQAASAAPVQPPANSNYHQQNLVQGPIAPPYPQQSNRATPYPEQVYAEDPFATYSTWPRWVIALLDAAWPVDIVVAWVLGSFCFIALSSMGHHQSATSDLSQISTFVAALMAGVVGVVYYLFTLAIVKFLENTGCIVFFSLPIWLAIGLGYFPVRFVSRSIVLPMLHALAASRIAGLIIVVAAPLLVGWACWALAAGTRAGDSPIGITNISPSSASVVESSPAARAVITAIAASNTAEVAALHSLDPHALDGKMTDAELARDQRWIQDLRDKGQYRVAELLHIDYGAPQFPSATQATVRTMERWRATEYGLSTNQSVGQDEIETLQETYYLTAQPGYWLVERVDIQEEAPSQP